MTSRPSQPRVPMLLHVSLQCAAPVPLRAEFDCAPGELVALVGPSGSGKTTLLRAIAGLYQSPSLRGVVRWDGAPGRDAPSSPVNVDPVQAVPPELAQTPWFDSARGIALPPQARRVGLVFQNYALFPHLNAIENVAACASIYWPKAIKYAQSQALLAQMGLADLAQRLPHQLSGGQQQRVALARALVRIVPLPEALQALMPAASSSSAPGVLLLDEPFSAVDAPMRQALYRALAELHAKAQLPIILVTHDLAEARRLADKVVILDGGATLQSGPPERVLRSPRNARVAQLVGIHNHFAGQFYTAPAPSVYVPEAALGRGQLRWGSQVLQVQDKGKIANDTEVTWVIAGDLVQVEGVDGLATQHLAGLASPVAAAGAQAAQDNVLGCRLVEMLPLGEISVCKLAVQGTPDGDHVVLNLSTALLRSLQAGVGSALRLHLPPQALHIMPLRE